MTGETILVVEDEGLIALHLMEMLEKAGYKVTGLAYSGEMVLKTLETVPKAGPYPDGYRPRRIN